MAPSNPPALENLGQAIRMRRTLLRMSQDAAARRGGMHRNYIGAIERGEVNPTYLTLIRVAEALKTSVSRLVHDATTYDIEPHAQS